LRPPKDAKDRKSSRKRPTARERKKQLIRRADNVFGTWIKNRDNWTCIVCGGGREKVIQCGHLIRRGKQSVRYDERNCCAQCASCNIKHNHYSEYYTSAYIKKFGVEAYQSLVEKSKEIKKWGAWELEEIIKKYGG